MKILLETDRLILTVLNEEYVDTVRSYLSANENFFRPFMPQWPENYLNPEQIEKMLQEQYFQIYKKQLLRLFIFHKTDKSLNFILGDITYSNIIMGAFRSCFVGYKTDKRVQGQGIATEALGCSNAYVFDWLNLHRIEANLMPSNLSSVRVVEKLGFIKEGYSPKLLKINGNWEDHLRYALINAKYED